MSLSFRFGTVGKPISTPKKPGGSVGSIEQIRALGMGAFEIAWVRAVRVSGETCAKGKAAGEEWVRVVGGEWRGNGVLGFCRVLECPLFLGGAGVVEDGSGICNRLIGPGVYLGRSKRGVMGHGSQKC